MEDLINIFGKAKGLETKFDGVLQGALKELRSLLSEVPTSNFKKLVTSSSPVKKLDFEALAKEKNNEVKRLSVLQEGDSEEESFETTKNSLSSIYTIDESSARAQYCGQTFVRLKSNQKVIKIEPDEIIVLSSDDEESKVQGKKTGIKQVCIKIKRVNAFEPQEQKTTNSEAKKPSKNSQNIEEKSSAPITDATFVIYRNNQNDDANARNETKAKGKAKKKNANEINKNDENIRKVDKTKGHDVDNNRHEESNKSNAAINIKKKQIKLSIHNATLEDIANICGELNNGKTKKGFNVSLNNGTFIISKKECKENETDNKGGQNRMCVEKSKKSKSNFAEEIKMPDKLWKTPIVENEKTETPFDEASLEESTRNFFQEHLNQQKLIYANIRDSETYYNEKPELVSPKESFLQGLALKSLNKQKEINTNLRNNESPSNVKNKLEQPNESPPLQESALPIDKNLHEHKEINTNLGNNESSTNEKPKQEQEHLNQQKLIYANIRDSETCYNEKPELLSPKELFMQGLDLKSVHKPKEVNINLVNSENSSNGKNKSQPRNESPPLKESPQLLIDKNLQQKQMNGNDRDNAGTCNAKEILYVENEFVKKDAITVREVLSHLKDIPKQTSPKSNDDQQTPKRRYTFGMLHEDDSTDDERKVTHKRPLPPNWSLSQVRIKAIKMQQNCSLDIIDNLFSVAPSTVNLKEIFPNINDKYLKRNSSDMWDTPPIAT